MKRIPFTFIAIIFFSTDYSSYSMNSHPNQEEIRRDEIFRNQKKRKENARTVNSSLKQVKYCMYSLAILGFVGWKVYVTDLSSGLTYLIGITPGIVFTLYKYRKASLLKDAYKTGQAIIN